MNVRIIETKIGNVVATVPVGLAGLNNIPAEREFANRACKAAMEDSAFDVSRCADYVFELD